MYINNEYIISYCSFDDILHVLQKRQGHAVTQKLTKHVVQSLIN